MDKLSQPLISIVFTSYNHQEYLRQALDSLLNQSYPNTEIIIIDDCSTDGSQEILREYEHLENINLQTLYYLYLDLRKRMEELTFLKEKSLSLNAGK